MKTLPAKRMLYLTLVLLLFTGLLSACGNSDDKKDKDEKVTVGIVNLVPVFDDLITSYKTGMAELGYIEGENITYIYHGAVGDVDHLDAEVQKLIDAHVDLILSVSTTPTLAAQRMTADNQIPVVFLPVTDPIASGIIDDLSHPGGNVTGIMIGKRAAKQLEWLQTFIPGIKRIYLPYNPDDPAPTTAMQDVIDNAGDLNADVVLAKTPNPEAVLAALQDMPEDIDAILVVPDSVVGNQFADIIAVANERKIPVAGTSPDHVQLGAFLVLGADTVEMGRQSARLSQQILRGTSAGDLPIEAAEYYITINLQAAELLGITIPDSTLSLADNIIR